MRLCPDSAFTVCRSRTIPPSASMSVLCRCGFVPAPLSQAVAHGCAYCPDAYSHEKSAESAKFSRIAEICPVHGPAYPKKQPCSVAFLSVHKKSASVKETLTHFNVIPMRTSDRTQTECIRISRPFPSNAPDAQIDIGGQTGYLPFFGTGPVAQRQLFQSVLWQRSSHLCGRMRPANEWFYVLQTLPVRSRIIQA